MRVSSTLKRHGVIGLMMLSGLCGAVKTVAHKVPDKSIDLPKTSNQVRSLQDSLNLVYLDQYGATADQFSQRLRYIPRRQDGSFDEEGMRHQLTDTRMIEQLPLIYDFLEKNQHEGWSDKRYQKCLS